MTCFLEQASEFMNVLTYSDDYGQSMANNVLWFKNAETACGRSAHFESAKRSFQMLLDIVRGLV